MTKPIVRLIGADGNSYAVISACKRAARQAGWSEEEVTELVSDMMSGDYYHLLGIAMDRFEVE